MSRFDAAGSRLPPSVRHYSLLDTPDARVRLAAMSTMASGLVHEVSQPLCTATNYLHACTNRLRKRGEGFEEEIAILQLACSETKRVGEILRRVRAFVASGRISGVRECLRAMVERTGAVLICADGVEVELVTEIPEEARFVMAARIQIELVLSSILEMACDALNGLPERRVTISAARLDDEIHMRILDSGLGLSDYAATRLFEPRFTTGLGMPVCKAIVEAHGGRLWVESPAGGGTRFNLSLPAAD